MQQAISESNPPAGGGIWKPKPENPSEAQLRAYGGFAFLYLRSEHHKHVPLQAARLAIQPPIDLLQFQLFHHNDVPRCGVTWAFLDRTAEGKLVSGETLLPAEWRSGSQMWVIEIIAPYGDGTAAEVVRWLKRALPPSIDSVRYLRVGSDHRPSKVLEVRRIDGAHWGTRLVDPSAILEEE